MDIDIINFQRGDVVRVVKNLHKLKNMGLLKRAEPKVTLVCGQLGVVRRTNGSTGVTVIFLNRMQFEFSPLALVKIFQKGDIVKITTQKLLGLKARVIDLRYGGEECRIQILDTKNGNMEPIWIHSNALCLDRGDYKEKSKIKAAHIQKAMQDIPSSCKISMANWQDDEGIDVCPISPSVSSSSDFLGFVVNGAADAVMRMVKQSPCLINTKFDHGQVALHYAVMHGHESVVQCLLENDCGTSILDNDGDNALHCAVHKNHSHLIEHLIHADEACLNSKNHLSLSPLHLAVRKQHHTSVKVLLAQTSVDLNTEDLDGDTPLHDAIKLGDSSMVDLLISDQRSAPSVMHKNKQGLLPFHLAVTCGNINAVERLLDKYSNLIGEKFNDGNSALHIAVMKDKVDIVKILLKMSHCNMKEKNQQGLTALHLAVIQVNPVCVQSLIDNSIDTGIMSVTEEQQNMTPLHIAAYQLMRKWNDNETPCNYANLLRLQTIADQNMSILDILNTSQCPELSILCYLLIQGADHTLKDTRGCALFDIVTEPTLKPVLGRFITLARSTISVATVDIIGNKKVPLRHEQNCVLCVDTKPQVTFIPCGHQILCVPCFRRCPIFKTCPRCYCQIESTSRTCDVDPICGYESGQTNRTIINGKGTENAVSRLSISQQCAF